MKAVSLLQTLFLGVALALVPVGANSKPAKHQDKQRHAPAAQAQKAPKAAQVSKAERPKQAAPPRQQKVAKAPKQQQAKPQRPQESPRSKPQAAIANRAQKAPAQRQNEVAQQARPKASGKAHGQNLSTAPNQPASIAEQVPANRQDIGATPGREINRRQSPAAVATAKAQRQAAREANAQAAQPESATATTRPGHQRQSATSAGRPAAIAEQLPADTDAARAQARDQRRAPAANAPTTQQQATQAAPATADAQNLRAQRAAERQRVAQSRQQRAVLQDPQDQARVNQFRENRQQRFAALQRDRRTLQAARLTARGEAARVARNEARSYWRDRADEVRVNVSNHYDNLFDDDWWEHRHWHHGDVYVSDPWWWWRPVAWGALNAFLDTGWSEPIAYDYGTDVVWGPQEVYVRGESAGPPATYTQRVVELANPPAPVAEAPVADTNWRSLGVWALAQEEKGDAIMFFQLSINRDGLINGGYSNVMSGENLQVIGQLDKKTQVAAWHIGDQKDKVFEAGLSNLTQDQASCLVHFPNGQTQNWLLVRLQAPTLPDQPAAIGESTP